MKTATPATRVIGRLVVLATAALFVAACSAEGLIEGALNRVEGVDDVDIDFSEEGGNFSVTSEEGETFGFTADDQGQMEITTNEGNISTTVDGEIPSEVTDAIDLPAGFTAQSTSRIEDNEDGNAIMVQGTIQGSFDDLLEDLEASISNNWPEVERVLMAEGHMGAIVGTDAEGDRGVHANLIMEDGEDEGMLQIMVLEP